MSPLLPTLISLLKRLFREYVTNVANPSGPRCAESLRHPSEAPGELLNSPNLNTTIDLGRLVFSLITFNARGIKSSCDYVNQILRDFSPYVICCINEHWLHTYDNHFLDNLFTNFKSTFECASEPRDSAIPRSVKGKGGVAILWHSALNHLVVPVSSPRSDRVVGVRICSTPAAVVFSVYLPTRSGCTDKFKSVMDELDVCISLYSSDVILFAGDFNADPGVGDGSGIPSFSRPSQ